jgi:hypothetical protein
MVVPRLRFWVFLCFLVFLCSAARPVSAQAGDDNAELRKKALALNDVTGDDPIKGEIKALLADPPAARKLVGLAAKMAKEKEQPFTYNGSGSARSRHPSCRACRSSCNLTTAP